LFLISCGSGKNRDCPAGTSHGIYCCELVQEE
jgi:hypothetical protein